MLSIHPYELVLLIVMAGLAAFTIREDIKYLAIPAIPVLALAALGLVSGIAFPLGTLGPLDAGMGLALGLGLGIAARAYTQWRIGAPAFGSADIALLGGGGAMLGPQILGIWVLCAVCLALLLSLISTARAGLRDVSIEDQELRALPFCPALILSWAGLWAAARAGLLPAGAGF